MSACVLWSCWSYHNDGWHISEHFPQDHECIVNGNVDKDEVLGDVNVNKDEVLDDVNVNKDEALVDVDVNKDEALVDVFVCSVRFKSTTVSLNLPVSCVL